MAKPGRIMTPVELIRVNQCIELDNRLIIRIAEIERMSIYRGADSFTAGYLLSTYHRRLQLFFEVNSLVDLVDESTLTRTPGDFD